eukprot:Transcript_25680.p1 GENE.Transcript_25680~~Transcript_25680.p1  ORF type:complete len:335 (-),score=172.60 Transcript_25680:168-1172(-)
MAPSAKLIIGTAAGAAVSYYLYRKYLAAKSVSLAVLEAGDDTTTNAIIAAFRSDTTFLALSQSETDDILARDKEDGDKLAAGIELAVKKGVLPAEPPVEPVTKIDVLGKSADAVAAEIIAKLGEAPSKGCVLVLQGLSGTGKGTTVDKLKAKLPKAVTWSNGNVFRSLTLLAVTRCEKDGKEFSEAVLTADFLAGCMKCLSFGKIDGKFDTAIKGYGLDLKVSEVANTVLKEPKVGKNIPTVAKMTQGEVVKFAAGAAAAMRADGCNVLVEGREQTLNHVRTEHRFELTLSQPLLIGMRRAAQRMLGAAQKRVAAGERPDDATPMLAEELAKIK